MARALNIKNEYFRIHTRSFGKSNPWRQMRSSFDNVSTNILCDFHPRPHQDMLCSQRNNLDVSCRLSFTVRLPPGFQMQARCSEKITLGKFWHKLNFLSLSGEAIFLFKAIYNCYPSIYFDRTPRYFCSRATNS